MHPTIGPYVTILLSIAVVVIILALALYLYFNKDIIPLLAGGIVDFILLVWIANYEYNKLATKYVINDEEIVEITGIWVKEEEHVPLFKIQDYKVERTIIQTLLGMANVGIETAAEEKTYEIVFESLSKGNLDWLTKFLDGVLGKEEEELRTKPIRQTP